MPAKEIPNYVKHYTEAYRDGSKEICASTHCPVCKVRIRNSLVLLRPNKKNEMDAKMATSDGCQKALLKHLEDHYRNGLWGNFDGQPQIYDFFQPATPTRWQRIQWALTGKKNKDELWVIK